MPFIMNIEGRVLCPVCRIDILERDLGFFPCLYCNFQVCPSCWDSLRNVYGPDGICPPCRMRISQGQQVTQIRVIQTSVMLVIGVPVTPVAYPKVPITGPFFGTYVQIVPTYCAPTYCAPTYYAPTYCTPTHHGPTGIDVRSNFAQEEVVQQGEHVEYEELYVDTNSYQEPIVQDDLNAYERPVRTAEEEATEETVISVLNHVLPEDGFTKEDFDSLYSLDSNVDS